ncbi:TPA: carbohydrate kinase [Candidatus Dependentiae bacterium]|nr:MAG: Carbohydrate/purine kinase pfkB family protein [candidate division TM6 bacterium GW2011_GWE2_31_21]KKP53485.1 MAG: Carbohydrate/purine kinase pfkB family protein [candidate division TM6 bacterium GW2011_GWF2_33_332]HBS48273.1 carbohydrate kinase [Candidatus Dependentiae bacterium]HBZ73700.1 carbohydrate kinase [Candidatus Dependentiae bacterium]
MKILTIGGATQDIFLRCQEGADILRLTKKHFEEDYMIFKAGEKIEITDLIYTTGGGATNSAVSFKRLGFDTSCFCKIGDDFAGKEIVKDLKSEKINIANIKITKTNPTGSSFIINSLQGDRTIFAYRGANGFIEKKDFPLSSIKENDLIYITSLSHKSSKHFEEIVKFAKKENKFIAINPGISQLAEGVLTLRDSLKYIDILILNSSEAKTLMFSLAKSDVSYHKILDKLKKEYLPQTALADNQAYLLSTSIMHENLCFNLKTFFKETLKLGPKIVAVTDGAKGVYVATKNEIYYHPSIKTKIVDTLGAGDAFGSAFVGLYVKTKNIEKALVGGIINSSSVISYIGAKPGLLKEKELLIKLQNFKTKSLQKFKF